MIRTIATILMSAVTRAEWEWCQRFGHNYLVQIPFVVPTADATRSDFCHRCGLCLWVPDDDPPSVKTMPAATRAAGPFDVDEDSIDPVEEHLRNPPRMAKLPATNPSGDGR